MSNIRSNNTKRPQLRKMKKSKQWKSNNSKLSQDLRLEPPNLKQHLMPLLLSSRIRPLRVNQLEKTLQMLVQPPPPAQVNSQMPVPHRTKTMLEELQVHFSSKFLSRWLVDRPRQLPHSSKNEFWSRAMTFLLNTLTAWCEKFKTYTTQIWKLLGSLNLKNS
jgi:hypothetical protein